MKNKVYDKPGNHTFTVPSNNVELTVHLPHGGTGGSGKNTLAVEYHEDCDPEQVKLLAKALIEPYEFKIETSEVTLKSHE